MSMWDSFEVKDLDELADYIRESNEAPEEPIDRDQQGGSVAEFVLGFKDLAVSLGKRVVGDPLTNQFTTVMGDGVEVTEQFTTKGKMTYTPGGQPFFLPGKFAKKV